ncbi:hypothetical protein D6789_00570 [Candidatus Woesearchaeota archaeon]|nr:MAG: hypothetical protein D6789_00570 [Candidatus Woesearchaeota archaeon]
MTQSLTHYVHTFQEAPLAETFSCLLVVKSQDQERRRARMLKHADKQPFGRVEQRPIEDGLLVSCSLGPRGLTIIDTKTFPEPRHIVRFHTGFLLTLVDRVVQLSPKGVVEREYRDPHFAFLHTIALHPDGERMLVVSSGYDAILELSLKTGKRTWEWFAWDNGFNPSADGVYLASTPERARHYEREGHKALYVDPAHYGPLGIVTAKRTAHPNAARYNPYTPGTLLVAMAHKGEIYELRLPEGDKHLRCALHPMAHGLIPHKGGWLVTDTTRGVAILFGNGFAERERIILTGLPKDPALGEREWVQQVLPLSSHRYLCLDANRGLHVIDTEQRTRATLLPDPSWCIQDALVLGGE